MKVSELAKMGGVTPQTVRYYESEGLLDEPRRGESGYRDYDHTAAHRLRFICKAKEIGFTLREIRELLDLDAESTQSCGRVQVIVKKKLVKLEQTLKDVRRIKKNLQHLLKCCEENPDDCGCLYCTLNQPAWRSSADAESKSLADVVAHRKAGL